MVVHLDGDKYLTNNNGRSQEEGTKEYKISPFDNTIDDDIIIISKFYDNGNEYTYNSPSIEAYLPIGNINI